MKKREHGLLYAAHGAAGGLICVRCHTTIQDIIFLNLIVCYLNNYLYDNF